MPDMDTEASLTFRPQRGALIAGVVFFGAGGVLFLWEVFGDATESSLGNLVRMAWPLLVGVCVWGVSMAVMRLLFGTIEIDDQGARFQDGLLSRRHRVLWSDIEWVELRTKRRTSPAVVFRLTNGAEKTLETAPYGDKAGLLNAIERHIKGEIREPRNHA